jgi:hypothetical protein
MDIARSLQYTKKNYLIPDLPTGGFSSVERHSLKKRASVAMDALLEVFAKHLC